MENRNNVIAIEQGTASSKLPFWGFSYPHQVVSDPEMDFDEKRAVLAAWASDVHVVEALPTLRHLPGTPSPVTFSSIMAAMARLDRIMEAGDPQPPTLLAGSRRSALDVAA